MSVRQTVGIYTLGCKVNQYESQAIAERCEALGILVLPPEEICDAYIINTCTVTGEADRKARQYIRRAISQNPEAKIIVTGCFSQLNPRTVAEIPGVDYICGNTNKLAAAEVAAELLRASQKNQNPEISVSDIKAAGFEPMQIKSFGRTRAFLKIEDGCESNCAYCIIPAARGKIRSKPSGREQVKTLIGAGCHEAVLTGLKPRYTGGTRHRPFLAARGNRQYRGHRPRAARLARPRPAQAALYRADFKAALTRPAFSHLNTERV